jgi:hypothetical protein
MRRAVLLLLAFGLLASPALGQTGPAGPQPAPEEAPPSLEPIRQAQRSAKLGVSMSMVVPGWGQLYADSPFWGLVAFGAQMYFLGSILLEDQRVDRAEVRRDALDPADFPDDEEGYLAAVEFYDNLVTEHRERRRDFVWWSAAGYFVIALDAYVSVSLADFDDPGVPTPDLGKELEPIRPYGEGIALRLNFAF